MIHSILFFHLATNVHAFYFVQTFIYFIYFVHLFSFFLLISVIFFIFITQPQSATVYFFCTISSSASSYVMRVRRITYFF